MFPKIGRPAAWGLGIGLLWLQATAWGQESNPASAAPVFATAEGRAALARGQAAEVAGRFPEAAREYAAAAADAVSGRHAIEVGIGRIAQVQGDLDGAIAAFGRATRLRPGDPILRLELAAAYVAAARHDDALAELAAALAVVPDHADALVTKAQIYLDTDRPEDAIPVLRRVLALRPERYATHYALATALSRVGRADEATREFQAFERLSRQALDARRRAVAGEAGPRPEAR